jgi:hypothetical protein
LESLAKAISKVRKIIFGTDQHQLITSIVRGYIHHFQSKLLGSEEGKESLRVMSRVIEASKANIELIKDKGNRRMQGTSMTRGQVN